MTHLDYLVFLVSSLSIVSFGCVVCSVMTCSIRQDIKLVYEIITDKNNAGIT